MNRFRCAVLTAFLAGFLGCGEDQPNSSAQPSELGPDFAKKTADMMKDANKGMDLKAAKSGAKK
jgi:hypothetical protein